MPDSYGRDCTPMTCPHCHGRGSAAEDQDPNDWPMGVVVCSVCWDRDTFGFGKCMLPKWRIDEYNKYKARA